MKTRYVLCAVETSGVNPGAGPVEIGWAILLDGEPDRAAAHVCSDPCSWESGAERIHVVSGLHPLPSGGKSLKEIRDEFLADVITRTLPKSTVLMLAPNVEFFRRFVPDWSVYPTTLGLDQANAMRATAGAQRIDPAGHRVAFKLAAMARIVRDS